MELKDVRMDGTPVTIKMMDESYVMCEDEAKSHVVVNVECRHMSPRWPNPLYSAYYRKLREAYGVGPVFVWHGRTIVGFLPVTVPGCAIPEPPLCVHYTGGLHFGAEKHVDLAMIEGSEATPFDRLAGKEIRIGCMSVHRTLRGKGLAASMIDCVVDHARRDGWDRIRARAMLDGEPGSFYPTCSFWLGLGFEIAGPVRSFGPSKDPIDRARAVDLTLDLTGR